MPAMSPALSRVMANRWSSPVAGLDHVVATVAVFAVFQGYAYGKERPEAANPASCAMGFVLATGLLHLFAIAIGHLWRWKAGHVTVRAAGVLLRFRQAAIRAGFPMAPRVAGSWIAATALMSFALSLLTARVPG